MAKELIVCFTGHRPKGIFNTRPYDEARRKDYQKIVDQLADFVQTMASSGYTRFISGGAQGFDQLAFWAVHNVACKDTRIKNIVYMPFRGQELRWAKTGLFSQKEYNQMLAHADEVKVCTETVDPNDFSQITNALMYRNKCMVNASDYVMGQFADDSWQDYRTKSGTADCLRYASKMGRTIKLFGNSVCSNYLYAGSLSP